VPEQHIQPGGPAQKSSRQVQRLIDASVDRDLRRGKFLACQTDGLIDGRSNTTPRQFQRPQASLVPTSKFAFLAPQEVRVLRTGLDTTPHL
jgi:hypothetical protein